MKFPKDEDWLDYSRTELERYANRPIFIVGSPRSGTTLMRSLMDSHPEVFCPPCETFIFQFLNPSFNGFVWRDHFDNLPFSRQALTGWLRKFVLELFANLGRKAGKSRWAEKTPSHVRFMDFIHETFPEAQFIHMIRNGLDVARSLQKVEWGDKDMAVNANMWVSNVKAGIRSAKTLDQEHYLEVRFEKLLADPEDMMRRICSFLGLEFHTAMLSFHLPENNSWGLSLPPLKRPELIGSHYGELSKQEHDAFAKVGGPLMRELGYW